MRQHKEKKKKEDTDNERFKTAKERLEKIKLVLRNVTKVPQSHEVQSHDIWETDSTFPCLAPEESQD